MGSMVTDAVTADGRGCGHADPLTATPVLPAAVVLALAFAFAHGSPYVECTMPSVPAALATLGTFGLATTTLLLILALTVTRWSAPGSCVG